MDIKIFLIEALKERYKYDSLVKSLEKQIQDIARSRTVNKYKDKRLIKNNMEYELIGVSTDLDIWDISLSEISIRLDYICCSKLPKDKRECVLKVKESYEIANSIYGNNNVRLPVNYRKIPLWYDLYYKVSIDNVLSNDINLIIG